MADKKRKVESGALGETAVALRQVWQVKRLLEGELAAERLFASEASARRCKAEWDAELGPTQWQSCLDDLRDALSAGDEDSASSGDEAEEETHPRRGNAQCSRGSSRGDESTDEEDSDNELMKAAAGDADSGGDIKEGDKRPGARWQRLTFEVGALLGELAPAVLRRVAQGTFRVEPWRRLARTKAGVVTARLTGPQLADALEGRPARLEWGWLAKARTRSGQRVHASSEAAACPAFADLQLSGVHLFGEHFAAPRPRADGTLGSDSDSDADDDKPASAPSTGSGSDSGAAAADATRLARLAQTCAACWVLQESARGGVGLSRQQAGEWFGAVSALHHRFTNGTRVTLVPVDVYP